MPKITRMTAVMYVAAVIVSLAAVYAIAVVYNPPQPSVSITYNSIGQYGSGYIIDTLGFPIQITSIFCTQPNGRRIEFPDTSNNTVQPGSNTYVIVGVTNSSTSFPLNCTDWKVTYLQGSTSNSISNGIEISQS